MWTIQWVRLQQDLYNKISMKWGQVLQWDQHLIENFQLQEECKEKRISVVLKTDSAALNLKALYIRLLWSKGSVVKQIYICMKHILYLYINSLPLISHLSPLTTHLTSTFIQIYCSANSLNNHMMSDHIKTINMKKRSSKWRKIFL